MEQIIMKLGYLKKEEENSVRDCKQLVVMLAAQHWLVLSHGRQLKSYDKLLSHKLRTKVATLGERYMRILLELDSIDAQDDLELKAQRRELVHEINDERLEAADSALKRAEILLKLDERLSEFQNLLVKSKEEEISTNQESTETAPVEAEEAPMELGETNTPANQVPMKTDSIESDSESENVAMESEAETKKQLPYDIREFSNYIAIRVQFPTHTNPNDIAVGLNDDSTELKINLAGYEPLDFDVRAKNLVVNRSRFSFDRQTNRLEMKIPLRRVSPLGVPPRKRTMWHPSHQNRYNTAFNY